MHRLLILFTLWALAVFPAYATENTGVILDARGVAFIQFHTLYGMPLGAPETNKLIARPIYCMSNNSDTKFADWVAYRIDAQTVSGSSKTKRNWMADPVLPENETLEPEDYKGANKGTEG